MILNNNNGLLLIRQDHLGERSWRRDHCYKVIFSPFGEGKYQTSTGDMVIEQDEFFIFNPDDGHKQLHATREKFLVELQPAFITDIAGQLGIKQLEPEFSHLSYKHPNLLQWMKFMREYISIHEGEGALFLESGLTQIAILMLQYGTGSHLNEFPKMKTDYNLKRVVDAIRESYREEWTLEEMAKVDQLNKYQFAHEFKRAVGLSPYSWLQLYRLFKSQRALLHTKESVLSIALDHGFKSVNSYNHLFKKIYHKTPTVFRSIHR